MKILLINAPYFSVYGALNVGHNHTFSLGLGYIASWLRAHGCQVEILDPEPLGMGADGIRSYIRQSAPGLIGLSCATSNFPGAVDLARIARESSKAPIMIGGVHVSAIPELTLQNYPQFDYVVVGEGELTALELALALEQGWTDFSDIKGLAFRRQSEIAATPPREKVIDIDRFPFPSRDLVDMSLYRPQVHVYRGRSATTMITSRGCPARCTYCAGHVTMGRRFRKHSPEYVAAEMEHLAGKFGVRDLVIADDTFAVDHDRVHQICDLILQKNLKIGWFCFMRSPDVSRELLVHMKRAGCFSVFVGVETADEQVLKNIKKGTTVEQAETALRTANELGLKTLAGYMFGNPGETHETIEKTIRFSLRVSPTIGSFNIMTPFPGTEEYDKFARAHPDQAMNWDQFVPKAVTPLLELENLSRDELRKAISRAYMRFYLRPSQIWRMLRAMASWRELLVYMRGALGLFRRIAEWFRARGK